MRPTIPLTCDHDGEAGLLRNGQPRCPMCRREARAAQYAADRAAAEAAARDLATPELF